MKGYIRVLCELFSLFLPETQVALISRIDAVIFVENNVDRLSKNREKRKERKRRKMENNMQTRQRSIFYSVAHTSNLQTLYSDQMFLFQLGVCSALPEG